ncbi:hypothetical protein AMS64_16615 [Aeromonas veronii]|nr:hypothetical protein AMS64_16615 [Aeromonas veronii]POG17116.1 hypothetical protein C2849_21190 [Aeromonas veronii]
MSAHQQIICCHFLPCGSQQCKIAHSIAISNQIRVVLDLQYNTTFISGLRWQFLVGFGMSQEKLQ